MPGDEEALFTLRSDPAVGAYLNRPTPADLAEVRRFIDVITESVIAHKSAYWALTLAAPQSDLSGDTPGDAQGGAPNGGPPIGTICLYNLTGNGRMAELGYELLPAFQGRGLMDEAVKKVIGFGTDVMGLERIDAFTHRENRRSTTLLQKNGFERDDDKDDGDYVCYALLIAPRSGKDR
jgi:ribosomal-protein-alanine N-acetyltransferase